MRSCSFILYLSLSHVVLSIKGQFWSAYTHKKSYPVCLDINRVSCSGELPVANKRCSLPTKALYVSCERFTQKAETSDEQNQQTILRWRGPSDASILVLTGYFISFYEESYPNMCLRLDFGDNLSVLRDVETEFTLYSNMDIHVEMVNIISLPFARSERCSSSLVKCVPKVVSLKPTFDNQEENPNSRFQFPINCNSVEQTTNISPIEGSNGPVLQSSTMVAMVVVIAVVLLLVVIVTIIFLRRKSYKRQRHSKDISAEHSDDFDVIDKMIEDETSRNICPIHDRLLGDDEDEVERIRRDILAINGFSLPTRKQPDKDVLA